MRRIERMLEQLRQQQYTATATAREKQNYQRQLQLHSFFGVRDVESLVAHPQKQFVRS